MLKRIAWPGVGQGVLSYVILRPLMTTVGVVAQLIGVFGDGQLRFDRVYLYTTLISNGSQVRGPGTLGVPPSLPGPPPSMG